MTPRISAILIDLSGTLHIASSQTPNAINALSRLRASGIPFRFCSNTSKESTQDVINRLRSIGFEVQGGVDGGTEEVWTSIGALKRCLQQRQLKKPYFLLGDSARLECSSGLSDDSQGDPYDSVVVGLAPSMFTYDKLNAAFQILTHEHINSRSKDLPIPLIATHKAKYIRSGPPSNTLALGPGPFVTALENASGVEAFVVGKPSKAFFETVIADMDKYGGHLGRIAIVGDDIEADLGGGAIELGLWRVLVKTGKYRPGDEAKAGLTPPDEIFDSFSSFIGRVLA